MVSPNPIDALIAAWMVLAAFVLLVYALAELIRQYFRLKIPRFSLLSLMLIITFAPPILAAFLAMGWMALNP